MKSIERIQKADGQTDETKRDAEYQRDNDIKTQGEKRQRDSKRLQTTTGIELKENRNF